MISLLLVRINFAICQVLDSEKHRHELLESDYDSLYQYSDSLSSVITALKGNQLISFKDTIIENGDTLVVRKETCLRTKYLFTFFIDSLEVFESKIFYSRDGAIEIQDTLILVQDTILTRNEIVINQIKELSDRKTWWGKILKTLLIFPDPKVPSSSPTSNSSVVYEPFEGKVIRSINIKVLNVFGYSIYDTDKKPEGIFKKGGDALHIKTHRWIIKNKLLFSKGDSLNSLKLSESERLLRATNFIYDARIYVRDSSSSDSIDVDVIVQDVWSISIGGSAAIGSNKFGTSVRDVNFLGLGQQIDGYYTYNPSLPRGYNLAANYIINNISNSYLSARFYYLYTSGQTFYGAGVNREYFSPAIRWAGGANVSWNSTLFSLLNNKDSLISINNAKFLQRDFWLAYGFNISNFKSQYKSKRLIFSGRLLKTSYSHAPILPDTLLPLFYNNDFYLGSVGVFARRYYKDSYVFRLGRTEDIPEGYIFSITSGFQNRSIGSRPYFGFDASWGGYKSFGYFYSHLGVGGFYYNKQWQESGIVGQFLYFTPLIKFGKWRYRHFIGIRYSELINPTYGNFLFINQDQGLRGLTTSLIKGRTKFVFNYEMNFLPPLNFLGFRAALIAFADLAWIANSKKVLQNNNFYPGLGVGMRIRNDHLIFGTVQIMLGYYPRISNLGLQELRLFESSRFYYNYYNFQYTRPNLVSL